MMAEFREDWDGAAASFDDQPDHGLRDPGVQRAWADLLQAHLPPQKSYVLDIGCGTGSLSLVIAGLGHTVTGIDFSSAMLVRAREKSGAAGRSIRFAQMDAARIGLKPAVFDTLLCRHLLWALPNPREVLARWSELLRPGGRLILIEGFWSTGAGLHAQEIVAALPASMALVAIKNLAENPEYWGKAASDERYLLVADQR